MEQLTSSATSFLYDVSLMGAIKLGTLMFVSKLGLSLDPPTHPYVDVIYGGPKKAPIRGVK